MAERKVRKPRGFPFAATGGNGGIERGIPPSQVEADEIGEADLDAWHGLTMHNLLSSVCSESTSLE